MVSMEDSCLNFTQPILSVRRGPSTAVVPEVNKSKINKNASSNIPPPPYYKSDIKSGPVRNPGVVPFRWEQSPGRPKDESTQALQIRAVDRPAIVPKAPYGSVSSSKNSGASKPQFEYDPSSISDTSENTHPEFEKLEYDGEEHGSSGSGDDNMTYQDALDVLGDTLSRNDSFLNCSLSGLSGLDRSGTMLSTGTGSNTPVQNFMMDRFLPAAKAVASEIPQSGSRKQQQPVCKEEPVVDVKQIIIRNNKENPGSYFTPEFFAYPHADNGVEEEEDDYDDRFDDEDEFEGTVFSTTKLCGLLPRFCLLNPLPGGMRYPAPGPVSPVKKIPKKPANVGAHMKNKAMAISDAVHERKRLTMYQKSDMRGSKALNNELKKLPFRVDPSKPPVNCGSKVGGNIPPYRSSSGQSLMQKERGLLGVPEVPRSSWPVKGISNQRNANARLRQLLVPAQSARPIREEPSSLAVKTLYIDDCAQGTEYQDSNSSSPESRSHTDSRGRNPSIDYSLLQDINDLCCADDKAVLQGSSVVPVDFSAQHELDSSSSLEREKILKDEDRVDSVSKVGFGVNLQNGDRSIVQQSKKEGLTIQDKNLLLPLPLPKSPSESWLFRARAIPSFDSSRTTNLKAYLGVGNQCSRASPVHHSWENAVRSSDANHNQVVVTMLTPIAEN